ncbi:MAG TPA: ATP-dependent sacrificial sulfur transferase LarE [Acidimicrobiales bacterium]|nr:ATP-dependent sacrificial sulfur transferase LarE [Acidimicrobiales bacterium]
MSSGTRLARLDAVLEEMGDVVVAFSGGADSAFLAHRAHRLLGGDRALCVTAVSPSLASDEVSHCRDLAAEWGLRWRTVATAEMDDPVYVANGPDRCARCKDALMAVLGPLAAESSSTVVLGVNTDDLGDYRPGQRAAAAAGARFPLVEAGLSKADVRQLSKQLGLRTWDRPAGACLASRLPYGTPVTAPTLRAVETAESALRALGLRQFRVRHHGAVARVEVAEDELDTLWSKREELVAAVKAAGYDFVSLDLEGFRSGSMNRLLSRSTRA